MFSRKLVLALALMPASLMAQQTVPSTPRDTSHTVYCRGYRYLVPNDTAARRDTTGVSKLSPDTSSVCARSTTSQSRPTNRGTPSGASRGGATGAQSTPLATQPAPAAEPTPASQPESAPGPRQAKRRLKRDPGEGASHSTHTDTVVVRDWRPSTMDRFFSHVEKHKVAYTVGAVVLTVLCIKECGGDNTQRTTVIVNR